VIGHIGVVEFWIVQESGADLLAGFVVGVLVRVWPAGWLVVTSWARHRSVQIASVFLLEDITAYSCWPDSWPKDLLSLDAGRDFFTQTGDDSHGDSFPYRRSLAKPQ